MVLLLNTECRCRDMHVIRRDLFTDSFRRPPGKPSGRHGQNEKPVLVLAGGRYVNPKYVVMVDEWKEIVMLHLIGHSFAISFEDWGKLRQYVDVV
jgi:hypothetical protein